jgi:hypothetical protein
MLYVPSTCCTNNIHAIAEIVPNASESVFRHRLDSSPYINTLFLEIVHTNNERSLPVVDQSRNIVETHAAP